MNLAAVEPMTGSGNFGEVLALRNLWAKYEREYILQDINLSVQERDYIGIVGPNGGGKTTLIKVLLGLLAPTKGEVSILGRQPKQARQYVGYVPQAVEFDRAFPISVWDVVRQGRLGKRRLFQPYNPQDDEIVARSLQSVNLLEMRHHPLGSLSGGQRQRVYIARALATEPQILLLDEPTANIDPEMTDQVGNILQELNQFITIVMISHDLGSISSLAKKLVYLNRRLLPYHYASNLRREATGGIGEVFPAKYCQFVNNI